MTCAACATSSSDKSLSGECCSASCCCCLLSSSPRARSTAASSSSRRRSALHQAEPHVPQLRPGRDQDPRLTASIASEIADGMNSLCQCFPAAVATFSFACPPDFVPPARQARPLRCPKHHAKVLRLAQVRHVQDAVGSLHPHAVHEGRQVGRGV